jgi:hypothetical protein
LTLAPATNVEPGGRFAAVVDKEWLRVSIEHINTKGCKANLMDDRKSFSHLTLALDKVYPLYEPFDTVPRMLIKCAIDSVGKVKASCITGILEGKICYICCAKRPKYIPYLFTSANIFYYESGVKGKNGNYVNLKKKLSSR